MSRFECPNCGKQLPAAYRNSQHRVVCPGCAYCIEATNPNALPQDLDSQIATLEQERGEAISDQDFEKAAHLRDLIARLRTNESVASNKPSSGQYVKLFISYRRADSQHATGRICDRLKNYFGSSALFVDVVSIRPGQRFAEQLAQAIQDATTVLVILGDDWLDCLDASGRRRLDDVTDYVRQEIETALREGKHIVPVLLGNRAMPRPEELPPSIRDLASFQGVRVRPDPDFNGDIATLIGFLGGKGSTDDANLNNSDETTAWLRVEAENSEDGLREFLTKYPSGMYSNQARRLLAMKLRARLLRSPYDDRIRGEYLGFRTPELEISDFWRATYQAGVATAAWGAVLAILFIIRLLLVPESRPMVTEHLHSYYSIYLLLFAMFGFTATAMGRKRGVVSMGQMAFILFAKRDGSA